MAATALEGMKGEREGWRGREREGGWYVEARGSPGCGVFGRARWVQPIPGELAGRRVRGGLIGLDVFMFCACTLGTRPHASQTVIRAAQRQQCN